ncbi:hypothetical protein NQ318_009703 [Aromia moschata]|uniref:Zinc metalloproteinase n=1 Tax=Aromia moschata TaxID=1265417 RepID=A0AAV8XZG2_9CUCU|nr:hypothetical protein NQ318_009703 [Aromia moschata]
MMLSVSVAQRRLCCGRMRKAVYRHLCCEVQHRCAPAPSAHDEQEDTRRPSSRKIGTERTAQMTSKSARVLAALRAPHFLASGVFGSFVNRASNPECPRILYLSALPLAQAMNNHNIKVINFSNQDAVTYPIVKLIGTIEYESSVSCQNQSDKNVYLTLNNKSDILITTNVVDGYFKFIVELQNGKNQISVRYCCETIGITLEYFSIKTEHAVIPLYVICEGHDGYFQAPPWENNNIESACKRITLCSKLLQCVTAEKLYEHNLGRKTFNLETDCQVFRSELDYLEARNMNQVELWETIGREIMKSDIGSENKKYLAFLSCTVYWGENYTEAMKTHEDLLQITQGYVALGGGGLALFGTACLYTWPESFEEIVLRFEDTTIVDRTQFLDDSCYRGTVGACFSTTLGSVLHELCHTFDLGHTEDGIMARGFDNIYKVFTRSHSGGQENVSKSLRDKIEFKEEFESDSLLERLQTENKKKEFTVIRKFEEIDDTFLTRSCAVLLCYHRWFNQTTPRQCSVLSFDNTNNLIKSTSGIRVVEIRSQDVELVVQSWTFEGRVLKFSFQIPQDVFISLCNGNYIIFVEDTIGCILKEEFRV